MQKASTFTRRLDVQFLSFQSKQFTVVYVKEVIFKDLTVSKERQSLAFIIVWP